jgi:type II secretory pathway component PulF
MLEIAALSRAGMPLPEGLAPLARSDGRDLAARAARELTESLKSGKSLGDALSNLGTPPSPEILALIRCAGQSGDLAPLAEAAAHSATRTLKTRRALENLTAYPVTVLAGCLSLYGYMISGIVKSNLEVMAELGTELDQLSRMVALPVIYGVETPVSVLCFVLAAMLFSIVLVPPFRVVLWRIGEQLPGIRHLARLGDFGNLMALTSQLTARGVPLPDALRSGSLAMTTMAVRESARAMADAAERAQPIQDHVPAGLPGVIPLILGQTGQRSGTPEAMDNLSQWCAESFYHTRHRAMARLEPVLLFSVGIVVFILVYTAYMPAVNAVIQPAPRIVGKE